MTPERIKELEEAKARATARANDPASIDMVEAFVAFPAYMMNVRKEVKTLVLELRNVLRDIKAADIEDDMTGYKNALLALKGKWDELHADLFFHLKPFIDQCNASGVRDSGMAINLINYAKQTMNTAETVIRSAIEVIQIIDGNVNVDE